MLDFIAVGHICNLLLQHGPNAVAVFDKNMRYLAVSERWLDDYHLEDRDLIGKSHYDLFPDLPERWHQIHRQVMAGETLSSEAEPYKRTNGNVDWVEWAMFPWRDHRGEVGGAVIFAQVVSDYIQQRQQTHLLNSELNLLINSAKQYAIHMVDPDGRITVWNTGAERLYGWRSEEVLGQPYDRLFCPEDRAAGRPQRELEETLERGTLHQRTWRLRKDGRRFLVDKVSSAIFSEDGVLLGYGGVIRDVTEETHLARKVEAASAWLRSILDTVPDAMITIDDRGIIESFSATAEQLFGYQAIEVLGKNIAMLMPQNTAMQHDGYLARLRATGTGQTIGQRRRVMGRRKDGSIFPHHLHIGEAMADGRRLFTGFLRDLTEQEQAEAKLREIQADLIHMSRVSAAGTMATTLAHELNQPLAAIANYVQTAAAMLSAGEDVDLAVIRNALKEAGSEAIRAGTIVQRLREFVTRGDLDRSIADPLELAEQARDLGAVGATARGINCILNVPAGLPSVLVDRVQIQQILLNLIRNAFEALGENGTVTISAQPEGKMLRFSVIDDGPGVAPGTEENLFQPFISNKAGGMGLGLAICRTIAEAHGGKLWCEAAASGGAAFHFTVPLAQVEDERGLG